MVKILLFLVAALVAQFFLGRSTHVQRFTDRFVGVRWFVACLVVSFVCAIFSGINDAEQGNFFRSAWYCVRHGDPLAVLALVAFLGLAVGFFLVVATGWYGEGGWLYKRFGKHPKAPATSTPAGGYKSQGHE